MYDVLSLKTFSPLGPLVLGTFNPWDILSLGPYVLGRFVPGTLCLGTLCLGTFCLWDLMSQDVLSLGPYVLGHFVPWEVLSVLQNPDSEVRPGQT